MDFAFTPEQERIREAIAKLCERFGDDYWQKKDTEGARRIMRSILLGGSCLVASSAIRLPALWAAR